MFTKGHVIILSDSLRVGEGERGRDRDTVRQRERDRDALEHSIGIDPKTNAPASPFNAETNNTALIRGQRTEKHTVPTPQNVQDEGL